MKSFFKILLGTFLLLAISDFNALATPKGKNKTNIAHKKNTKSIKLFSGAKYEVVSGKRQKLLFTKKITRAKNAKFVTSYTVYNEKKQEVAIITAIHYKKNKAIEVRVKDLTIAGFPITNVEKTEYEIPYTGRFGSVGKIGAIGKGRSKIAAPSQLSLSFSNRKFDFVKIISVADAHENSGKNLEVFELEN